MSALTDAIEAIARQAIRAGRAFEAELANVWLRTERNLRPLIQDASEGKPTAIIKAVRAAQTKIAIREALTRAGFDTLITSATDAPFDALVQRVLSARAIAGHVDAMTTAFDRRVQALKALYESSLLDEGDDVTKQLWQAMMRGIFGAQDVGSIVADLGDILDRTRPQIRTLYDTSISIFGRQVEALQAGNDPETPFLYQGPDDEKTRDFCQERVGKVFTRAEIDQMDNGQLDNAFLTGGGYNCRHQWMEVSKYSQQAA